MPSPPSLERDSAERTPARGRPSRRAVVAAGLLLAALCLACAPAWAQAPEDTTVVPEPEAAAETPTDTTYTSPDPGFDPNAATPADTMQAGVMPIPAEPLPPPTPPTTLDDLDAWLEYKARTHAMTMPLEARV